MIIKHNPTQMCKVTTGVVLPISPLYHPNAIRLTPNGPRKGLKSDEEVPKFSESYCYSVYHEPKPDELWVF